jgi:three-Cys-motif partner protein
LILETAIADPEMRRRLVTIFNDKNSDNSKSLEEAIESLPGIEKLKYMPSVENEEVGEKIVAMFHKMRLVPTLFFVDPWGYKGLTLQLVNSVLKDWGCDCIVFFNYNRINMGLTNPAVESHLDALFGSARAAELRQKLPPMNSIGRETIIVEYLAQALKDLGGKYVLMSDLFHKDVPTDYIKRVFDVMCRASWHRYQVLTKRSERLRELSPQLPGALTFGWE